MAYKNKEDARAYGKRWYQANKEKRLAINQRFRKNRAEKFLEIKKKLVCEVCGETHIACLDFHHKDSREKVMAVGTLARGYAWVRVLKEIAKCIILCANCHRKEHYDG